jgi:hypothetical protein
VPTVLAGELPTWLQAQSRELLVPYRSDIGRHLERVKLAREKIGEAADQLLQEVVVDGELTVPGAAAKLSAQLKTLIGNLQIPEEITYKSVQQLVAGLEELLRGTTEAGRRFVPRLPKVHKRVIKELDFHVRMIGDAYGRIRKAAEKNPLPLELSRLDEQAQEVVEKTQQLIHLVEQLEALRQQKTAAAGKVEEQREGIEHFRVESGLAELDEIRREIDAIRMLVTNQLNFLKKPFKGLTQSAGKTMMVPPTAAEAADAYSMDPWQAFLDDTEGLTKLKEGLTILVDAVRTGKLDFKQAIDRKISERQQEICEKGTLDQLRHRYAALAIRQQDIRSAIPLEQRQALEKTLDRAQWEHRDIEADIAHTEEQVQRIGALLGGLEQKLEKALSRLLRDPVRLEFPAEISAIVAGK